MMKSVSCQVVCTGEEKNPNHMYFITLKAMWASICLGDVSFRVTFRRISALLEPTVKDSKKGPYAKDGYKMADFCIKQLFVDLGLTHLI